MNGGAYYNENDPYAAEWLRNLIAGGHIAPGEVDTRSICDVAPADLRGFAQAHLFAGIGGWSYALRLAGVPDNETVWTGSCPCQPFSAAGKRKGAADERHLWPEMYRLIAACKPERVLGEQVEAAVRLGWIDGVFADLAREDYACGFAVLGAHSVGAPHIRQRIYWVADARRERGAGRRELRDVGSATLGNEGAREERQRFRNTTHDSGADDRLADAEHAERRPQREADSDAHGRDGLGGRGNTDGGMGDTDAARPQGRRERSDERADQRTPWSSGEPIRLGDTNGQRRDGIDALLRAEQGAVLQTPWSRSIYIPCADGKARRVEPGIQPLAHGVSARVGKLRAAGNAIVPQVAAEFIAAALTRSV